ncbi:MAG TPA: deoxyuridine 5'-triphosphate nucleotidohydrolase, partial [Acidilobales archaeon]|nr:deoxyuridine 5'-triphosphate nucleotidohydrolase [Acidilobales archaeon]
MGKVKSRCWVTALNDRLINELGIIRGSRDLGIQLQPAGFDLSASEIHRYVSRGFVGFRSKRLPKYEIIEPKDGVWYLGQGVYRIVYNEVVSVPDDTIGFCLPRSTLLRCGATVYCAFWDPGYIGRGEGILHVLNPNGLELEVGARVAQLVFIKLIEKPSKTYSG